MRAIIQRVCRASVEITQQHEGNVETVGSIGRGLLVFLGISTDDSPDDSEFIMRKILNMRIFEDENGKHWNKSVTDKKFEILLVSQFTLYGILKGNKPDFHYSMPSIESKPFYDNFVQQIRRNYAPELIQEGKFGEMMQVSLVNDGPVTMILDSKERNKK